MNFKCFLIASLAFCLLLSGCSPIQYLESEHSSQSSSFISHNIDYDDGDYGHFPKDSNKHVDKWIKHFSEGNGRPHMARFLERSTRYLPLMKTILRKHSLPEDLVYVAMAESGFSSQAVSSKLAVGYWQFMPATGRGYGLAIDSYVDERQDFVLATDAAARYLKKLYSLFGSWHLALAAYNAGEKRINDIVFNAHNRNFWTLIEKKNSRIPEETANFVPKIIAMREIASSPWKYNFEHLNYKESLNYQSIYIDQPFYLSNLSEVLKVPYEQIKSLNPKYKKDIVPLYNQDKVEIRVPAGISSI